MGVVLAAGRARVRRKRCVSTKLENSPTQARIHLIVLLREVVGAALLRSGYTTLASLDPSVCSKSELHGTGMQIRDINKLSVHLGGTSKSKQELLQSKA